MKRITLALLTAVLFASSVALLTATAQDAPTVPVQHDEASLGITPQPNNALCYFDPLMNNVPSRDEFFANPPATTGLGYGMGAENLSDPDATNIGANTMRVAPQIEIQGTFHLMLLPGNPGPAAIRYIVLLNEQQIPAFDDDNLTYDLTLQPGDRASFEVRLPPLPVGVHDLIVIGVVQEPIDAGGAVVALIHRATLVAGDSADAPSLPYELLSADRRKRGDDNFFPFGLHVDASQTAWVWPEAYREIDGDTLDFFASAGYMESVERLRQHSITPPTTPFALVAFLDGTQVPLRYEDVEADVLHLAVEPGNLYSFVPLSIDVAGRSGRSELMVLRINYPRTPMCWLMLSDPNGTYFDANVYARRVGVDVGPEE